MTDNTSLSIVSLASFGDANYCMCSRLLRALYRFRWTRSVVVYLALRLEDGQFFSGTLRELLCHYHGVRVGEYSYGACMSPGAWPSGVTVGRYVSVGYNVKIFLRNHPQERLSMHPFFYNKALGYLDSDNISNGSLEIGHDAWIGANVFVTSGCSRIGIGAVVGTGSIVTKDVPDFAVVAGNPAHLLRYRFKVQTCKVIIESKWWENPVYNIIQHMPAMITPIGDNPLMHPLLKNVAHK